jgi:beta-aspartyl-peptidase (threonine type)
MTEPVLVIHGGAGAISRAEITPELRASYETALRQVLEQGERVLAQGGSALDAVTEAVRLLEECPLFNAGHGAVFTSAANHELDAAIMEGATLRCGAVANLTSVRNPVLAARAVMEQSPHALMVGAGAEAFLRERGLEMVPNGFFSTPQRREQLERVRQSGLDTMVLDHDAQARAAQVKHAARCVDAAQAPLDEDTKFGTVGAVALDAMGNLAAATSTGGMTNKRPGRVGDSPLIGAGCYAHNAACAVSATGTGEAFIRAVAAHDIAARMRYAGASLEQACNQVVHEMLPQVNGAGGVIAVDAMGTVCMPFNTQGMYRGYVRAGQAPFVAIHQA